MFPDWRINFDTGAMEELLGRSGITNDTTVIGYGDFSAIGALIFWLLKVFGQLPGKR
jgi:thiosulfate/3-mercaptopyruvate sulfurtransferase